MRKAVGLKQQKTYFLNLLGGYVRRWERRHHRNHWWCLLHLLSLVNVTETNLKRKSKNPNSPKITTIINSSQTPDGKMLHKPSIKREKDKNFGRKREKEDLGMV